MRTDPSCQQCGQPLTQVGRHWICPDHGQVSTDKPFAPLRIFLSYGHDANEELVRRIYADLKQRGHDVWFDKNDITFGEDWRRSITSGITECDRFFSFLSKHSTRDPGVCLDEIRIAIGAKGGNIQSILVESEQEVKLPPSISHIQWLDMHDWQERRASGEAAWDAWYQEKLAEIIRVVESDESQKFAGEIRTLEEYLKPVVSDFAADARIQKLLEKKLTGRAWLFDAVEKWRTGADRSSRIFWMMGAPGFGKSFFAAHLAHFYGRGAVIGVHFCAYDKPDHRSAPRIIRTLAFQLATRLPDYRKLLLTLPEIAKLDEPDPITKRPKNESELFGYILANPLKLSITGGRERHLIVIDALDEASSASAQGCDRRNELVEMLARHAPSLPDWIGLVVTSRPESDVRAPLQGQNPFVLDTATEANRADLRGYLRHELEPQLQPRPDADRLVEQILERSEGVFLYAERFCDDVQRGHLSLDHPEQFPQGLGGIFFQYFQRQFPDVEKFRKEVRPALRAILAARETLPMEILQGLFNWQDEELRDFTRPLGSLFPVAKETRGEVIKPYHKSIADWAADEEKAGPYFVSTLAGHRLLGEHCFHQWQAGSRFAISEVVHHLQFDTTSDKMLRVFLNPAYYERKFSKCGWVKLYEDLVCFASHPLGQNTQLSLDDSALEVRALFSIAALIVFDRDVPRSATILRRFVESGCNRELLEVEREKLRLEIASAEWKPRTRREESNHFAANTAHFYEDYIEHLLKAEDAALALKPARMIDCLKAALRFQAIYSCDGDPIGAVNIAIQEAAEDINTRLPTLQRVAFRLNAGIGKPEDDKMAKPEPPPASTSKLNSGKQDTEREKNSRNTVAEGPQTYVKHGAWCDMVDYSGRGFPQDMDFVCRICGHCEGVGHPTEVPPACPKCGNEGRE